MIPLFRRLLEKVQTIQNSQATEYNAPGSPVWEKTGFMHLQRYDFVSSHVCGKRVLNVGCGPGYAEHLLARAKPREIVSIDYDQALISRLRQTQDRVPVPTHYVCADVQALPTDLGSFDVIVSLENIEHLEHPRRFLSGLSRLAANAATLILSTPNRLHYSSHPVKPSSNPYHVREFDFEELETLLSPYVADRISFGQFVRTSQATVDRVEEALRAINMLWAVRAERHLRRLLGRPVSTFHFLPLETDLRPLTSENWRDANTFVVVGKIKK